MRFEASHHKARTKPGQIPVRQSYGSEERKGCAVLSKDYAMQGRRLEVAQLSCTKRPGERQKWLGFKQKVCGSVT
jgi:hypothetical protein